MGLFNRQLSDGASTKEQGDCLERDIYICSSRLGLIKSLELDQPTVAREGRNLVGEPMFFRCWK